MPHPRGLIDPVELQEFLFASASATFAAQLEQQKHNVVEWDKLRDHIRGAMRIHRFTVINWLMMQGVKIPVELLDDKQHPEVGQQMPDRD